jgi:hypothetical protein
LQGVARGGPSHIQTKLRTSGEDWDTDGDLRVEVVDHEEEDVEEIYNQLWVIPKPDKVWVPSPALVRGGRGCLVWVRKDLLRENKV